MTTTSADNGASAGDGDNGDTDRGWFAPARAGARPGTAAPDTEDSGRRYRDDERDERHQRDSAGREMPSRPVREVRPVGSGAERARGVFSDGDPAAHRGPRSAEQQPSGQERGPAPSPLEIPGPDSGQAQHSPVPPTGLAPAPAPFASTGRPGTPAPSGPGGGRGDGSGSGSLFAPAALPASPSTEIAPARSRPSRDAVLIQRTLDEIGPSSDSAIAYFYALLFLQNPQLRDLFPASMDTQRDRLFKALLNAVRLVDDGPRLTEYLAGLGRGHRKYGTRPEHYPLLGEALLGALARYAPASWTAETEQAWVRAYTSISQIMIDSAAADEPRSPAWWQAEIVSHELRTPDIAVLTVRPDQPYPFLAGQYTSIETPWWPRVWRHYSLASSPRHDGLLTFHVKAVPAGWVSAALVHRARVGDVLRLGPPAGSMTVDHVSDGGLLCLGGGTGIAPIKALVEDVAEHGRVRPVEVFYGARSDHDLYELDTMLGMEQQHPWLSVRPVVSAGPGSAHAQALVGQLPDVIRRYGPWASYQGYLSGPPGMIRNGLEALLGSGIPARRIRHDSIDELVADGG